MPTINRIADFHDEITAWRRDFHQNPELMYDVHRTAGIVAEKLKEFGCDEVVTGIGRTGVVGIIKGKKGEGRAIGLRADMDALPIQEIRDLPHKSETEGKMHACGHDGHTAMLLGAAKYLAETRNFAGTAVVIFQPAEEGGAGGKEMVDDGMMDRWDVSEVYGMHNMPGLPVGAFSTRPGAIMAATDEIQIHIEGCGGHAAQPNACVDPTLAGAAIMQALQSIVSRNVDPVDNAVVSVTTFHAGDAFNVIPQTAKLTGTVRTLDQGVRDMIEARIKSMVPAIAEGYGCTVKVDYLRGYPVTVNHEDQTAFAVKVASEVVGDNAVEANMPPKLGGEDFSYMLEARPGAMILIGNGDTAGLHHPEYDFNDDIIPIGCSYWARLVETSLPAA
jgi:hippurate hydrolase